MLVSMSPTTLFLFLPSLSFSLSFSLSNIYFPCCFNFLQQFPVLLLYHVQRLLVQARKHTCGVCENSRRSFRQNLLLFIFIPSSLILVSVCPLLFSFFFPSSSLAIFAIFVHSISHVFLLSKSWTPYAASFTRTLINNASSTETVVVERGIKRFKVSKQKLNEGSVIYFPSPRYQLLI